MLIFLKKTDLKTLIKILKLTFKQTKIHLKTSL